MNARHKTFIILASILLHILFLFLWEGAVRLKLFDVPIPKPAENSPAATDPIVFDLQQPDQPREVIETPADAKTVTKQEKANFLSDKNALARNPERRPDLKVGEPFAVGDLDVHELPQVHGPAGQPAPPQELPGEKQSEKQEELARDAEGITRTGELVNRHLQAQRQEMRPGVREQLPTPTYDNQQSRALDMGGLSFNTYDWNFAPYMLELKRRIQRNIHPPPAFTELGLISGETLLRFKIYPNGMLKDLQILDYNGHKSLMVTSSNAVEVSAPFPGLPREFPEDYLEVTGKFIYTVTRTL